MSFSVCLSYSCADGSWEEGLTANTKQGTAIQAQLCLCRQTPVSDSKMTVAKWVEDYQKFTRNICTS
jgi:hypothetical protein